MNDPRYQDALDELESPRASVLGALAALDLRPGPRLLDAGCATGYHLPLFAERVSPGGRVTGLDLDPERLAVARQLCAGLIRAGAVSLQAGSILDLPFEPDSFDVAWTSLVLHHVEEPARAIAELARVTRPGGTVAVMDGDGGASFPILPWPPEIELSLRTAALQAEQDGYGGKLDYYFSGYLGRQLPRLCREAGLADIRLHPVFDVDRAPLTPKRAAEIRDWFDGSLGRRVRDYIAPRDWERVMAFLEPSSPRYLLASPDFFMVRASFLVTGVAGGRPG